MDLDIRICPPHLPESKTRIVQKDIILRNYLHHPSFMIEFRHFKKRKSTSTKHQLNSKMSKNEESI